MPEEVDSEVQFDVRFSLSELNQLMHILDAGCNNARNSRVILPIMDMITKQVEPTLKENNIPILGQ